MANDECRARGVGRDESLGPVAIDLTTDMSELVRVAAFTGGRAVPSARFRVRQHGPTLARLGIEIEELPCRFSKYPPRNSLARPLWVAATLWEQATNFAALRRYDVVLLQREIISKLVTFERWISGPAVLDVDDAIFLFRDGYVARRLAQCSTSVICGNGYLAEWFSRWNSNVHIIPTAVDTERYHPVAREAASDEVTMGWIGTSSNLPELTAIVEPLGTVLARFPKVKLRVVCDRSPHLPGLNPEQVEYLAWTENTEVACIQGMDIGIMPLQDSLWARGKCSMKMIQYMACGLPSVVSAVGMNTEVARLGDFSVAVGTRKEWADALIELVGNAGRRRSMGAIAREVAERVFSVSVLAPKLAMAIRAAL